MSAPNPELRRQVVAIYKGIAASIIHQLSLGPFPYTYLHTRRTPPSRQRISIRVLLFPTPIAPRLHIERPHEERGRHPERDRESRVCQERFVSSEFSPVVFHYLPLLCTISIPENPNLRTDNRNWSIVGKSWIELNGLSGHARSVHFVCICTSLVNSLFKWALIL